MNLWMMPLWLLKQSMDVAILIGLASLALGWSAWGELRRWRAQL